MTLKDIVLRAISERFNGPFNYKQLGKAVGVKGSDRKSLINVLNVLVHEGVLVMLENGRYSLPRVIKSVKAKVSCHKDGYGFAIPEDPGERDIFLPPHTLKDVYDGDSVLVKISKIRKDKKTEGEIIKIEKRGHARLLGKILVEKGRIILKPLDPKLYWPLIIKQGKQLRTKIESGTIAVAKIIEYPRNGYGTGFIEEVVTGNDYVLELKNLILKSGVSEAYPQEAVFEANNSKATGICKTEKARKNLRRLGFVTIDGDKAKDFDDAIYLEKEKKGYRLFVAIADVSHFVHAGGPLDEEAFRRGNSYYFPDRVIPMLPEVLANDICSLKPGLDRASFTVELFYDHNGRRLSYDFYPSYIKSSSRLTYEQVEDGFNNNELFPKKLMDMLLAMRKLTELLYMERYDRGSIDFDLPEPEIIIGMEGKIENVIKAKRLSSHRMIEEFMIAANRAVAEWFVGNDIPAIYRIHEKPEREKIRNLALFLKHLGYDLKSEVNPLDLQKVLKEFRNTRYEKLVNTVVLRSLKQARYSSEPLGHFGLALDDYLHFTSPIRRYADLVVHRNLRTFFKKDKPSGDIDKRKQELEKISGWISKKERIAMELEREILNFSCAKLMNEKIGEEFTGIISSVISSGFYVELLDIYAEGFVPVETIKDDYYTYEEVYLRLRGIKRKKIYYIGKEVNVKLTRVDINTKKIEFSLIN